MLIYKVTNNINGQIYIGQTTLSLEQRKYKHEQESRSKYRKTVKFHNALLKYGFSNFTWEILRKCNSQEELDYFEKYYIQLYDSCNRNKGYNLKYGGRTGGIFSEEAKENLSKSTKLKWENPECAEKMLKGLRKGTETMKEKASKNYIEHICPVCRKTFRTKNWDSHIYCSIKCANQVLKNSLSYKSKLGVLKIRENYLSIREERMSLIKEWVNTNKDLIIKDKLNNLKFLNTLAQFIGVKDTRSLGKVLEVKYKKDILFKLKNIIKCTPNNEETH